MPREFTLRELDNFSDGEIAALPEDTIVVDWQDRERSVMAELAFEHAFEAVLAAKERYLMDTADLAGIASEGFTGAAEMSDFDLYRYWRLYGREDDDDTLQPASFYGRRVEVMIIASDGTWRLGAKFVDSRISEGEIRERARLGLLPDLSEPTGSVVAVVLYHYFNTPE